MPRCPLLAPAAALAAAATLGACGGSSAEPPTATTATTAPASTTTSAAPATTTTALAPPPDQARLDAAAIRLEEVVALHEPVALTGRQGDDHLWVAERAGVVQRVRPDGPAEAVLDISGSVTVTGEQGLLGLAFSPEGDRLYLSYTATNDDSVVDEYRMAGDRPDPASARTLLRLPQPSIVHNGGHLVVTADGLLWLSLGDGGPVDAPDRAQDLTTLYGSILRIDPSPSAAAPYQIPPGNPFAASPGGARPEIWAYGLRNPWRFSIDRATGDLWIGDVGQYITEEVNHVPAIAGAGAGANFGWRRYEGTRRAGPALEGHVPPVHAYNHDGGDCAVVGGHVYRGRAVPALAGAYVFGDLCGGFLQALGVRDGQVIGHRAFGDEAWVESLVSFGEDADGELYALSLAGKVLKVAAG